jgi:hypothetical protein
MASTQDSQPIDCFIDEWIGSGPPQTLDQQGQQEPRAPEKAASHSFQLEVAGYVNFPYVNDDAFQTIISIVNIVNYQHAGNGRLRSLHRHPATGIRFSAPATCPTWR